MKKHQLFYLGILLLPWLSVPFLGKWTIRRFSPSALFISCFIIIESMIARKRVWWWFYKKLHPKLMGEIPYIFGTFFVSSLWIMKFTYGKFKNYFLTNLILDFLFVYPGVGFLKKMGYLSLVRLKKYQLLCIFLVKSLLMYGFQVLYENRKNQ